MNASACSLLEDEILSTWIAERRAILQREGCAVRAGAGNTIEVQIINSPLRRFATLTIPISETMYATRFRTAAARDAVLALLQR